MHEDTVKLGLSQYEETQRAKAEEKGFAKRLCLASRPITAFTCSKCGKDCHSRIGLHSHKQTLYNGRKSTVSLDWQMPMTYLLKNLPASGWIAEPKDSTEPKNSTEPWLWNIVIYSSSTAIRYFDTCQSHNTTIMCQIFGTILNQL